MRLWSVSFQYLDSKGLVALWRETLLAKNVLANKTKGYKNHPQLIRFKRSEKPEEAINQYLSEIYEEATRRNYKFNPAKIDFNFSPIKIPVHDKQIEYEFLHLLNKLKIRDPDRYKKLSNLKEIETANIFFKIKGEVEEWEITGST
ncbi:MAG: DNA lyase [Bacteroidia bacterium]|nr:MAG: DNA lyase [Bacteroidia bacterium]